MAIPARLFSPTLEQVANAATAQTMLAGIRAFLDEYAREIFDLWFEGKVNGEVTFDNPKWANYMRAEPNLTRHIDAQLNAYAESIAAEVDANNGRLARPFKLTFHAEVGTTTGGYRTGYAVLHGSNKSAGDFQVTGNLQAVRLAPANGVYTVTYNNLVFVFNDVVDANKKYASDVTGLRLANNIARVLHVGPPRDYILRIKWSPLGSKTFQAGSYNKNPGAAFLPPFPRR
ncbi:MAG TPA: hypothetical protein VJR58_29650 [Vineibacter sp.]|nr:hypothetical protein [Vineibacter sp.]